MDKFIGVVAGTPVDTKMGLDILLGRGIDCKGYPISENPKEQSRLQLLSKDKLYNKMIDCAKELKDTGAQAIFVYCNSLSAAIDMIMVSQEVRIPIVTPFLAYGDIAKKYSSLLVLGANGQSCSKIETVLEEANPNIKIWSISSLPLVEEIESDKKPEKIFMELGLDLILKWAETNKIDGIVLGCTHFPYIADILKDSTNIDIIDPVDNMINRLVELKIK